MQKMEKGPDGKYPYKSPMDCAMQTLKNEVPFPKTPPHTLINAITHPLPHF